MVYVEDHVRALDLIASAGVPGNIYNIEGMSEHRNIDLTRMVCVGLDDAKLGVPNLVRASSSSVT
jgi:dTDP-glucose 4,6-dehydratase